MAPSTDAPVAERIATALLISPHQRDHIYFDGLFSRTKWKLHHAFTGSDALELIHHCAIGVIIVDEALDTASWNCLLDELQHTTLMPKLLVASLLAEGGCAEALNSDAFDILARPLNQEEVLHSISMAWLAWRYEHDAAGDLVIARSSASA